MKFQNNAKLSSIVGGDFVGGEVTRYRSVKTITAINLPFFTAARMFSATTQNTLSSSSVRVGIAFLAQSQQKMTFAF